MIINNSQNPYAINEIYTSKPLRNESSSIDANIMPTDNRAVVETGVSKRPLNNTPPNFIRHVLFDPIHFRKKSLTSKQMKRQCLLNAWGTKRHR